MHKDQVKDRGGNKLKSNTCTKKGMVQEWNKKKISWRKQLENGEINFQGMTIYCFFLNNNKSK